MGYPKPVSYCPNDTAAAAASSYIDSVTHITYSKVLIGSPRQKISGGALSCTL